MRDGDPMVSVQCLEEAVSFSAPLILLRAGVEAQRGCKVRPSDNANMTHPRPQGKNPSGAPRGSCGGLSSWNPPVAGQNALNKALCSLLFTTQRAKPNFSSKLSISLTELF